ncbi:MAG: hypothetical protein R3C19_23475 [Planctomycetaceae bacterium]
MTTHRLSLDSDSSLRCADLAEMILQICDDAVVVVSAGAIVAASASLLRLLRYPPTTDVRGWPLAALLPDDMCQRALRRLQAMSTSDGVATARIPCVLKRHDSGRIVTDVSARRCEDDNGGGPVTVLCFHPHNDATGLQALSPEESLQCALDQRSAVFGEIASVLVHELSQPVTVIHGASELLREALGDGQIPDTARRAAGLIVDAGRQLSSRFRRVWDFIRARQPNVRSVSMNDMVTTAMETFEATARQASADVQLTMADSLPDVLADASLVQLVIVALLNCCVRSGTAAGQTSTAIHVTTRQDSSVVELRIEPAAAKRRSTASANVTLDPELTGGPGDADATRIHACQTIVSELGGVFCSTLPDKTHDAGFCLRFPFVTHERGEDLSA